MGKITASKFARKFVQGMDIKSIDLKSNKPNFNIEKRYEVLPAVKNFEKGCEVCHKVMTLSVGQIARFHRECRDKRKDVKRIIAR